VVFYAVSSCGAPETGVTGDAVAEAVVSLVGAYYRKRAELVARNLCPCEACSHLSPTDC
jgi:hypothetical protein